MGGVASAPDRVDDLLVLVVDPAQELGALQQVGEPARVEDHGDHVGPAALVDLHQPAGQHLAGVGQAAAQLGQVGALAAQCDLRALELRPRPVELGLHLGLAALQDRDVAVELVDDARQLGHRRRERLLARARLVELGLGVVEPGGIGAARQSGPQRQGDGRRDHERGQPASDG